MILSLLMPSLAGISAPTAPAVAVDGSGARMPRPAVVLLWATWCTSCRAELKRIPELERAAAPLPIIPLAMDSPADARRGLAAAGRSVRGAFADTRPPATVLAEWGGANAALPLAVAIDGQGHVCGSKRGLLGTDQLRQWAAICSR